MESSDFRITYMTLNTGKRPIIVYILKGDAICRLYLQSYMHGGPRVQNFRISLPSCPVWEKLAAPPKNTRTISTVRTLGCHHAWPDAGRGVGDVGLQYVTSIRRVHMTRRTVSDGHFQQFDLMLRQIARTSVSGPPSAI